MTGEFINRQPIGSLLPGKSYQHDPDEFQTASESGLSIKTWIIIIFILVALIGTSYYFLFGNNSKTLTDEDFSNENIINLEQNEEIKFKIGEEEHKIIISSVFSDSVDIIIQSEPINANIKIGETKKFDVNGDGIYDISVKLESIVDGKVNLILEKINETICSEDWNCTEWAQCLDNQTRTCSDLNNCSTQTNKPVEFQACNTTATCASGDFCKNDCSNGDLDCSCSAQNGTICDPRDDCKGTYLSSFSSIYCCRGECVEEVYSCDDWDCFITSSDNCNLAIFTNIHSIDQSGVVTTSKNFMEIRGLNSSKCIYYQKIENNTVKYSDSYIQQLLGSNMTQQEIDQAESDDNTNASKLIGVEFSCRFGTSALTSTLNQWSLGSYSGGISCVTNSSGLDCTFSGDLGGKDCKKI